MAELAVVEQGLPAAVRADGVSHQNEGLPADARAGRFRGNGGQGAADDFFIRPRGAVHHCRRGIGGFPGGDQPCGQFVQLARAEEERQRGSRPGKGFAGFSRGHGRSARGARQHQALGESRIGQFRAQGRRRGKNAADPRHHDGFNSLLVKQVELLRDGSVHGGVPRVEAHHFFSFQHAPGHHFHLFLQVHSGAVMKFRLRAAALEVPRVDQGPGIHDYVGLLQEGGASFGNQVFGSGAGSYEMDGKTGGIHARE